MGTEASSPMRSSSAIAERSPSLEGAPMTSAPRVRSAPEIRVVRAARAGALSDHARALGPKTRETLTVAALWPVLLLALRQVQAGHASGSPPPLERTAQRQRRRVVRGLRELERRGLLDARVLEVVASKVGAP